MVAATPARESVEVARGGAAGGRGAGREGDDEVRGGGGGGSPTPPWDAVREWGGVRAGEAAPLAVVAGFGGLKGVTAQGSSAG
jgi:hypothetical protein